MIKPRDGQSWWWAALCLAGSILGLGCRNEVPAPVPSSSANSADSQAEPPSSEPLRLLVVDDPALARAISGQWRAMAGSPLEVVEQTAAELEAAGDVTSSVDVVIYPTALLGTLAERGQIVPLPEDLAKSTATGRRELLEMTRIRETVWGETVLAVPLGSAQLLLLYRKDLFEELQLSPPKTWAEYQTVAQKLAERPAGTSGGAGAGPWFATAEPLGPGWRGLVLLARAAAYGRFRGQYSTVFDFATMKPRLDNPPFVRALDELVAAAKLAGPDALARTPHDARQALARGTCGMALAWPSHADEKDAAAGAADAAPQAAADEGAPSSGGEPGVARLPGARDVYNFSESRWEKRTEDDPPHVSLLGVAGRLGSVTKTTRRARPAFNFLLLLSTAEWHPRVLAASPAVGPFRVEHLATPKGWVAAHWPLTAAADYATVLRDVHKADGWWFAPRIPGRAAYLEALDEAVAQAVRGEVTSAEALAQAAARWNAITDERGREAQALAYRRCLGLEK